MIKKRTEKKWIMTKISKKISSLMLLCGLVGMTSSSFAMEQLTDDQMSNVQGQALLNLNVTNPGGSNPNSNIGFYRLGMEASIELNANVKKLQLGCGGVKGTGCDIDIDNVALTGITTSNSQGAGTTSDFVLNNPFIEFAIENPTSAASRNIVGFRLGALSALGMMSLGSNSNTSTLSDDTGINSLSGDIGVTVSNATIKDINLTLFGAKLLTADAKVENYSTTLVANRSTSFSLTGLKATAQINAPLLNLINLNLTANMNDIPYSTVHRLQVSDANGNPTSGAYLSLQSKDITWQNIATNQWSGSAKQGWWLSIPQTQFKDLNMDGSAVSLSLGSAIGGILGATVNIPAMDLGQVPVNNCYGSLKFC